MRLCGWLSTSRLTSPWLENQWHWQNVERGQRRVAEDVWQSTQRLESDRRDPAVVPVQAESDPVIPDICSRL